MVIALFGCSRQKNNEKMAQGEKPNVHIGYYLKTLDNLLTQRMDNIHSANGITRAEWQILNGIAETPGISADVLLSIVKEFTDYSTAKDLIEGLLNRGLVVNSEGLKLTESGKKTYAYSLKMQKEFREKVMQGITEREYENVISTLDRAIKNLSN
jgi:DNA-binding MarR family transcriptional regulator